jgi:hypothetical protein
MPNSYFGVYEAANQLRPSRDAGSNFFATSSQPFRLLGKCTELNFGIDVRVIQLLWRQIVRKCLTDCPAPDPDVHFLNKPDEMSCGTAESR